MAPRRVEQVQNQFHSTFRVLMKFFADKSWEVKLEPALYVISLTNNNFEDTTIRTLKAFFNIKTWICEDLQHTHNLLQYFKISYVDKEFIASNEKDLPERIKSTIKSGLPIGFASKIGRQEFTESDYEIIREALDANLKVFHLPGPSISISAILLSGLSPFEFFNQGFLSSVPELRHGQFLLLKKISALIIIYELSNQLFETLKDIKDYIGNVQIFVGKDVMEPTEFHYRGNVLSVIKQLDPSPSGNFIILIENNQPVLSASPDKIESLGKKIRALHKDGHRTKDITDIMLFELQEFGFSKKEIYKMVLKYK